MYEIQQDTNTHAIGITWVETNLKIDYYDSIKTKKKRKVDNQDYGVFVIRIS